MQCATTLKTRAHTAKRVGFEAHLQSSRDLQRCNHAAHGMSHVTRGIDLKAMQMVRCSDILQGVLHKD